MNEQKVNIELTLAEAQLLLKFLEDLNDKYGNAGCNDLMLDNTDENWQMVTAANEANGEIEERPNSPEICTFDFMLCDYLANAIENQLPVVMQEPDNA